jgi:hypothetical protein
MAEIKKVEVTGDELERRIRVQLEFTVRDAEEMLNKKLVEKIADVMAKEWVKKHSKKMPVILKPDDIGRQVVKAIVQKAVFNLAVEMAHDQG